MNQTFQQNMLGQGSNVMNNAFNYNQPNYNQVGASPYGPNTQMYTIVAPSDSALLTVKDDIMKNDTLIDQVKINRLIIL